MNFDQIIDRNKYPTMKWEKSQWREHFGNEDLLPFWVADMDFQAPPLVIDSLQKRVAHGIFGYEYKKDDYFDSLFKWYAQRHLWEIDPTHLEACPSVLSAIAILINQHSDPGDGIIVQPPVFFDFRMVIKSNGRQLVKNPLKLVNRKFQMDFNDLEAKAADPKTRILVLCNPHNPVGRVWTREELTQVGEICRKHDVLVISDEIHGDIVYPPNQYTPLASISDELAQTSITCFSPGKTFNLVGMIDAMAIIPDEESRNRFHEFTHRYQINKTNVFASAAIETAYKEGAPYLEELLLYLQANVEFVQSYLLEHLPRVKLIEPEGTYLIWLDFKELELDVKELAEFLAKDAGIALNPGYWFGREGAGFARMNIASPRSVIEKAMNRLRNATDRLV